MYLPSGDILGNEALFPFAEALKTISVFPKPAVSGSKGILTISYLISSISSSDMVDPVLVWGALQK